MMLNNQQLIFPTLDKIAHPGSYFVIIFILEHHFYIGIYEEVFSD